MDDVRATMWLVGAEDAARVGGGVFRWTTLERQRGWLKRGRGCS